MTKYAKSSAQIITDSCVTNLPAHQLCLAGKNWPIYNLALGILKIFYI